MSDYDDVNNQQSVDPYQGGASTQPPTEHDSAEPTEHKSTLTNGVEMAHLGTEGAGLISDTITAGKGIVGKGALAVGPLIGIGETIHDAVTGEGCAGDKATGIVPLMGPLSTLMMPSWCGSGPAEQTQFDTGMTPSQERAAGLMTPADPTQAPTPLVNRFLPAP